MVTCGALCPTMGGIYDAHPCVLKPLHTGRCMTKWGDHFDREPSLFSSDWLCVIYQSWGTRCEHSKCERTAQATYAERRKVMERALLAKEDPEELRRRAREKEKQQLRGMLTMHRERYRRYG